MKKRIIKLMISVLASATIMTSLPVNMLSVQAEQKIVKSVSDNDLVVNETQQILIEEVILPVYQATNGTFGDNNGFSWSYDNRSNTLTVKGEDSGLNAMRNSIPDSVLEDVKKVIFQDCVVSGSLEALLQCFYEIESIEFHNFDTTNVTDMSCMFDSCSNLESLDVSGFDTGNVTNMGNMFSGCSSLKSLNVVGFDTSNVTNMAAMFMGCSNLESLDVRGFDTSNVTYMESMFDSCSNLKSLDVSGFDTSTLIGMRDMFRGCSNLESLDVSSFDTGNVTDMSRMFGGCSSLISLDLGSFDTKNVTTMNRMFEECESLSSLDVSGFDTSNVTDLSWMFYGCSSLKGLDVSGFNTKKVIDMSWLFCLCESLKSVDVSAFDTSKVTDMTYMFCGCENLVSIDLSSFNTTKVKQEELYLMLMDCSRLQTIKTPKIMAKGQSIWFDPDIYFCDSEKNLISDITRKHCNKTLKRGYAITYNLYGGKNSTANPEIYTKNSATITLKEPSKTGYQFKGWYMGKNKITKIVKGSTGNKELDAKWTPNKYTIKFDKNGATSGKMSAMKNRKYGTKYTLPKNTFKRKGYTFTGWNTKKNGKGKSYKNKAKVSNLVSKNGSSITLYAQWKKDTYKITYKLNGGKNSKSNPNKYSVITKTTKLKSPIRKGYTFKGWYQDKKFKKKVTQIKKGSTGNITLYAKWVKKK